MITALISIALACMAWRRREVPAAVPLIVLALASLEWSLAYMLEIGCTSLHDKIFWDNVGYLGVVTVPVAAMAFALRYTSYDRWLTRANLALLAVIPATTVILAWTNSIHGLIRQNVSLDTGGPFLAIARTHGPWFWVHVGFSYLMLILGSLVLIRMLFMASRLYRGQAVVLLLGMAVPWSWNVIHISGLSPLPKLDLTVSALAVCGLAMAWGLYRFGFMEIMPIARDAVIDGMADPIIALDLQGRIVDLNPAAQEVIGLDASEAVGRLARDALSRWPHLLEKYKDDFDSRDVVCLDESGKERYFDLCISPLRSRRGDLKGRLIVMRDITERKLAEEELQERDALLSGVAEASHHLLTSPKFESGIHQAFQIIGKAEDIDRIYMVEGRETEQLQMRPSFEWSAHDERGDGIKDQKLCIREYLTIWQDALSRGEVISCSINDLPAAKKGLLISGEIRSVLIIPITIEDRFWGLIGFEDCRKERIWEDFEISILSSFTASVGYVLTRKRANDELAKSERRYKELAELLPQPVFETDTFGRVTFVNRRAFEYFGYSPEDVERGFLVTDVVVPEERQRAIANTLKLLAGEKVPDYEYTAQRMDKSTFSVLVNSSPIVHEDKVIGLRGVVTDITDRKRAEEMLKASLQEKEVLLKEIHHRVKNNLQVVSSLLSLQSGYVMDYQAREGFKESQNRIRSMALVHEKLYKSADLSRINFSEYIGSIADYLRRSYAMNFRSIRLNLDVDDVSLNIDNAIPCGLIVNELISNCLKHAFPQGKAGDIFLSLHSIDGKIELIVRDNGVGLPKDMDIRKTKSLGITLVSTLVKQLKGTMEMRSESGTEFKITFKPGQKG
ncbi:MAG TPA: histidine kinase N-terminal 7TM domain-containing protein [Methanotrichaceae archaeon]|nr:histidine kinase N-terminal 7TM domain-containing protein [Methanotrichaceae archaeon]